MVAAIACLCLAFPAPRGTESFAGTYEIQWGECRQVSTFKNDGAVECQTFGNGTWTAASDKGSREIAFSERGGTYHYVMVIDANGEGSGWRVEPGEDYTSHPVTVKITRKKQ